MRPRRLTPSIDSGSTLLRAAGRESPVARTHLTRTVGTDPTIGQFKDGRGEFYDMEPAGPNGRSILVRFIWSKTDTDSPHFEQSFSDDGGKTWEVNWITDQVRVSDESGKSH
jgi:hypothetical protein